MLAYAVTVHTPVGSFNTVVRASTKGEAEVTALVHVMNQGFTQEDLKVVYNERSPYYDN